MRYSWRVAGEMVNARSPALIRWHRGIKTTVPMENVPGVRELGNCIWEAAHFAMGKENAPIAWVLAVADSVTEEDR